MTRSASALLAAGVVATSLVTSALVTTAPAQARSHSGADAVRSWNAIAMTTMTAPGGAGIATPEQPLYLAYVHRAVYDGVRRAVTGPGRASVPATVSAAAYRVLTQHFPAQAPALHTAYVAALDALPDDGRRDRGVAIGTRAAQRLLRDRAGDGRNGTPVPLPALPTPPGVWSPVVDGTPGLSSWLAEVRPFARRSPDQLRPPAPPALGSARWARDFEEVRAVGGEVSTVRTEEQTAVARFWAEPPFVQNQRGLRDYAADARLGALGTARLFALADTAAADALIACWDAKYRYQLWRPVKAVPRGDTDGNAATVGDPGWKPLLVAPNHPEYPSAHSCATTALARVLASTSHGRLDLDLHAGAGPTETTRHYSTMRQLTTEVSNARVWGGLHWRFSTKAGESIGRAVSRQVLAQDRRLCR